MHAFQGNDVILLERALFISDAKISLKCAWLGILPVRRKNIRAIDNAILLGLLNRF